MNINSGNIGELAGNQSILDKKKENTSKKYSSECRKRRGERDSFD